MTGESYQVKPQGAIVVRNGDRVRSVEKILTEAAKPGMLVTIDGNDYKAKKAAANTKPFGWVGFEHTDVKTRPETYETAYASGDVVAVVYGADFDIYAIATGSTTAATTFTAGDLLASNDDGTLKAAGSDDVAVARALETITIAQASTAATARIRVQSLI